MSKGILNSGAGAGTGGFFSSNNNDNINSTNLL